MQMQAEFHLILSP